MMIAGALGMTGQAAWRIASRRGMLAMLALGVVAGACASAIGLSTEGRPLTVRRFGDGPQVVLLVGGLHTGSEDNTRVIVEQLAAYLDAHPEEVPDSVTVLVLPSANPDGTALGLHTNARGVDLNRNWPSDDWVSDACHPETGCERGLGGPSPLSEPETAALYALIETTQPEITIVWHAEAPLVEANEAPGAETYGRTFAQAAGYEYIDEWQAYEITGELIDALEQRLGLRAFDVEMSECCVVTPEEFDRSLAGLIATLNAIDASGATPTPVNTPKPAPTTGIPPDIDL
jgi:predicted deacylase